MIASVDNIMHFRIPAGYTLAQLYRLVLEPDICADIIDLLGRVPSPKTSYDEYNTWHDEAKWLSQAMQQRLNTPFV